jgi:hypothetical protein
LDHNTCRNCGKKGHWGKDYRSTWWEKVNLTHEDDEELLLMAWVLEISIGTTLTSGDGLRLHELMAHVFLGFDGDDDECMEEWYLDTGMTRHMMGR